MHSSTSLVYTLLSLAPLAARADLQLDGDDISTACQSICRPVRELSQICDVEDDQVGGQPTEDNLTLQCYCLNTSFDVGDITPLCQSCMSQNPQVDNDDDVNDQADDLQDINEIVSRCGFTQATYAADQANTANGIVVAATRPTAASQLTTTVVAGGGATQTTGTVATTGGTASTTRTTGTTATGTAATSAATATGVTVSGASDLGSSPGGWAGLLTYVVCAAGLGAWAM